MPGRLVVKFALFTLAVALLAYFWGVAPGLGFGFAVATSAWIYGNSRLAATRRWLDNDGRGRVPSGQGLWDDVFSLLYRQHRAHAYQVAELSASLERFRKAAEALPDAVITLTSDDRILFCNDVAATMFGLDPQADLGHAVTNLVRLPDFTAHLHGDDPSRPLVVRLHRDEPRMLQMQVVEVGDGQRLLLARDVTQLDRLETMRRDFVANVSHELKTPLTVLAGFLETVRDHHDMPPEQRRHFIDVMNEQALRMRRIVEELLALSALESTPLAPADNRVELDPMIRRLETAARGLSQGRHDIRVDAEPGLALRGSELELASAFENLISNAIRYTPDGGSVDIRAAVVDEAGEPTLHFTVVDTGIGIETQHIPRLTERFYRVDRSRSRDSGGTGLGLAIVKHVLTRHEGTLRVESEYGRGTTMTAVFPAQRVAPAITTT